MRARMVTTGLATATLIMALLCAWCVVQIAGCKEPIEPQPTVWELEHRSGPNNITDGEQ